MTTTTVDNDNDNDDHHHVAKIVARVAAKAPEWRALPLSKKISLLQQILQNTIQYEQEWNQVAFASRGINNCNSGSNSTDHQGCARADVLTVGPATLGSYLNGLIASLQHCHLASSNGMMPPPPLQTRTIVTAATSDGTVDDKDQSTTTTTTTTRRAIVTVWPRTMLDKLEAVGLTGELVVTESDDHKTADDSTASTSTTTASLQMSWPQASAGSAGSSSVAGILGAGNVNAPIEILSEMFLHGRVVLYKPNPVNQQQAVVLMKRILHPLIAAGYLEFVRNGDNDNGHATGAALVSNPLLDHVVLTGSAATWNKIQPLIHNNSPKTKTMCAELGGVNPWIVVPSSPSSSSSSLSLWNDDDDWNAASLDRHARHLALAKMTNNGHTCAAPQVILVDKHWPHRQAFMQRVRYWLGHYAGNAPFYPGSATIHARFAAMPHAEMIVPNHKLSATSPFEKQQYPILITNVDLQDASQKDVFELEAFCPVLAEVPIECCYGNNDKDDDYSMAFLKKAVQVAENKCFGSLTANILIPDSVLQKSIGQEELDQILVTMPFGVVGVNVWPALAHAMPMLTWGAPPGHAQSGIGHIGNAHLYRNVQKTILRAPFNWLGIRAVSVMSPRKTEKVFSRFATYKLKPSLMTQSMLFAALFLGL